MVRFESVELTKRLYGEGEGGLNGEEEEEVIGGEEQEEEEVEGQEVIDQGVIGDPSGLENKEGGSAVIHNQSEISIYDATDINNALSVVLVDSNNPYGGTILIYFPMIMTSSAFSLKFLDVYN